MAADNYHHGDLRLALLNAGVNCISEGGVGALTLRKLAKQLEVSHTACYRHFANKDALLASIIENGFVLFLSELQQAYEHHEHVLDKLFALGLAYVNFANNNYAYYRMMFYSAVSLDIDSTQAKQVKHASDQAFGFFIDAIKEAQQQKFVKEMDAKTCALYMWSTLHGYCSISANLLSNGGDQSSLQTPRHLFCDQSQVQNMLKNIYSGIAPK